MKTSFEDKYIPVTESGCWLWTGATNSKGYGYIFVSNAHPARIIMAHRHSYERSIGPIPKGLQLDHLCRVRCCVNPHHLEPVDTRTNLMRGVGIAKMNALKTHCIHGHEFTETNTELTKTGERIRRRRCITCRRKRDAKRWRKKEMR